MNYTGVIFIFQCF